MTKKQNNATTCNQPNGGENGGGKVTPAHYEELEELQLESVAGGWLWWGLPPLPRNWGWGLPPLPRNWWNIKVRG